MKLVGRFKFIFLATLLALYFSGVLAWVMANWFHVDAGYGLTPRPQAASVLHWHSVIGLWFLAVFGYFYHSHILVSWRFKKKLRTGLLMTLSIVLVMVTVPGLFYLTDGDFKNIVTWVHVYVGLALVIPYALHQLVKA